MHSMILNLVYFQFVKFDLKNIGKCHTYLIVFLVIINYEWLDRNSKGCIMFWCSENFFIPMNNSQLWLLWYAPSNLSLSVAHALLPLGVDELENWHPSFKTLFPQPHLSSSVFFLFLQRRKYRIPRKHGE